MTELKQNVLDALDILLDSDELTATWTDVNNIYHKLEGLFEEEDEYDVE